MLNSERIGDGGVLSDDSLFIAARAAALAGVEPAVWLAGVIQSQANVEESRRQSSSSLVPGPWPGWTTETFDNGWIMHRSPDGVEISFMPQRLHQWSGTSLRPWAVRRVDGMLRSRTGRIRTFASEYTAKSASDALTFASVPTSTPVTAAGLADPVC